jgi:hypothetical protein
MELLVRNAHFQFADLVFRQQIANSERLTDGAMDERILELWTENQCLQISSLSAINQNN